MEMGHSMSAEQAQRYLDLANIEYGQDLVALVENAGSPVAGENTRQFSDGKPRLDMLGFAIAVGTATEISVSAKQPVRGSKLVLVRRCDSATASLANLLKSQTREVTVQLSAFKASGDAFSPDQQPTLEIVVKKARISEMGFTTSSKFSGACEVTAYEYENLEIHSAPQVASGQRGAVRISTLA